MADMGVEPPDVNIILERYDYLPESVLKEIMKMRMDDDS